MASAAPQPFDFAPGSTRDGTPFDSTRSVDSQWVRWRLGRPRKIGGTNRITDTLTAIPRHIHIFNNGSQTIVHVGTSSSLQQIVIDSVGNVISTADRTPASFTPGATVGWTIDAIFDTQTNLVQLVAQAVADLQYSSSTTPTVPFIGSLTATAPLTQFVAPVVLGGGVYTQPSIAGGIVSVQPYVFAFDANGRVQWSAPNIPLALGVTGGTTGAGQARVSAQKIFAGMPLRGGGTQQPAVIFWAADSVVTGVFVGSPNFFSFSTLSPSSSIMSTDCVVEYDGIYYWTGVDRFLSFNGTVVEVPNQQNQDWFFNNINRQFAGKCFTFKIPRYGEIWFCAPLFGNTECSHAAILNVREQCWYDTVLPDGGRSCAAFAQQFSYPLMGGITPDANGYKLWQHEIGTDEVDGTTTNALRSYFTSPFFGGPKMPQPRDDGFSWQGIEPDFIQSGNLTFQLTGYANPRAPASSGAIATLALTPSVPQEQLVNFMETYRYCQVHVESNVIGGNFIAGRNLLRLAEGDKKVLG